MLLKTHLAIGLAAALYFLPHMNEKSIFFVVVLISTFLPEIGTILFARKKSLLYKKAGRPRPLGGITRTYTFLIPVSIALAFIYPIYAFPFFLGYSFNLFMNAFTPEGITPFWPLKRKSTGNITPGGAIDYTIFILVSIFDIALLIKLFL